MQTLEKLAKKILHFVFCWFFVASSVLPADSFAAYDAPRSGIGYHKGSLGLEDGGSGGKNLVKEKIEKCETGDFRFDPFLTGNVDVTWKLDNPTCIGYISSVGSTYLALDIARARLCAPTNPIGLATYPAEEIAENSPPPPVPVLDPTIPVRILRANSRCAKRYTELTALTATAKSICVTSAGTGCAPAEANMFLAATDAAQCCGAVAAYTASIAAYLAALGTIYELAKNAYHSNKVCGHGWYGWTENEEGTWVKGKGIYKQCIENNFLHKTNYKCRDKEDDFANNGRNIKNTFYREFIFGGIEYEDSGGECKNPWKGEMDESGISKRLKILGYESDDQRYYMTGPGNAPSYACHRFLLANRSDTNAQEAYECCKRRSKETMCIEGKNPSRDSWQHKFCKIGSKCTVASTVYEIYESRKEMNYACAKTYNWCPYDHLLGGGSEYEQPDFEDSTKVANYCQHMNHCSKLPVQPYFRMSSLEGGYISSACRDLRGDSQNVYGYTAELIPINTRGFSAPLVQCFKETMQNIFLHKAGYTKCENPDEFPRPDGTCDSGYLFEKGEKLPGDSFFSKVQERLQGIIQMILIISITFFGIAILFAVPGAAIEKKKLLPYIAKIGLVLYFATGTGWHDKFVTGIFDSSTFLAELTFRNDESASPNKLDGCQFPRFNYANGNEFTRYDDPKYPPGKDYLRVWDTLDCKIARALGFGPNVSVPNIIMMIMASLFTGGAGVVFFVGAFIFAFLLISLTIRAMHIILISVTAVVLLIYVSPLTIAASLFDKTKGIFDGWWKQLLGFTLQPMILFAYLGIFITLFDAIMIGDVTFNGDGIEAPKSIICSGDAKDTSMYCIFRVAEIGTHHGFEAIGIGIPFLKAINDTIVSSVIKGAIIMFVFAKFMDQISYFAAALVGGKELKSDWKQSAGEMLKKSYGALRGVQKRGLRGSMKVGRHATDAAVSKAKSAGNAIGNKGKSIAAARSKAQGASATTENKGVVGASAVREGAGAEGSNRVGENIGTGGASATNQPKEKGAQRTDDNTGNDGQNKTNSDD